MSVLLMFIIGVAECLGKCFECYNIQPLHIRVGISAFANGYLGCYVVNKIYLHLHIYNNCVDDCTLEILLRLFGK